MKFLKYFEDVKWADDYYEAGDYVLIRSIYHNIIDEPVIIDSETEDDIFACSFINKEGGVEVYIDEIVRKLEDYEIDALKYNL